MRAEDVPVTFPFPLVSRVVALWNAAHWEHRTWIAVPAGGVDKRWTDLPPTVHACIIDRFLLS